MCDFLEIKWLLVKYMCLEQRDKVLNLLYVKVHCNKLTNIGYNQDVTYTSIFPPPQSSCVNCLDTCTSAHSRDVRIIGKIFRRKFVLLSLFKKLVSEATMQLHTKFQENTLRSDNVKALFCPMHHDIRKSTGFV